MSRDSTENPLRFHLRPDDGLLVTAGVLQVPLVFATVPGGCTGDPHDRDSGPTGNPHDPSDTTSSGFEIGNPHDGIKGHDTHGDFCPGS